MKNVGLMLLGFHTISASGSSDQEDIAMSDSQTIGICRHHIFGVSEFLAARDSHDCDIISSNHWKFALLYSRLSRRQEFLSNWSIRVLEYPCFRARSHPRCKDWRLGRICLGVGNSRD